jgi:hypothetical protein
VPAGVVVGGAIGGVFGYFGGSHVGGNIADAWYGSLDRNVRERVDRWFIATPNPIGT